MQQTDTTMTEYEKLFDKISLGRTTPLSGLLKYIPSEFLLEELLRRNQEQRIKEAKEKYEELINSAFECYGQVISEEPCENNDHLISIGIRLDDESVEKLGILSHQRTVHYKYMLMRIGPCFKVGDKVKLYLISNDYKKYWPPVILEVEPLKEK